MATKLIVSIIFLLFTICYAESQLEFPQRDVVLNDDVTDLPQSDSKTPSIFLPSQKTESEINKLVDSKPDEVETVPLTIVTFRPINRHFRQGPLLPFRHGRRCGGFGRRGLVKPWLMRFKGGEIPYGKDVIEDKSDSTGEHGGVQEMPAKIEGFGRGGEGFEFGSDMAIVPLHRHHHRHHRHHHRFHVEEEEEEKRVNEHEHRDEDEEEEEHHHHHHRHHGGFFWKIRKFLHHF